MERIAVDGGVALIGDSLQLSPFVTSGDASIPELGFPLAICDPPYGQITKEKWDIAAYLQWFDLCASVASENATIAMWGGVGKFQHRPFLEFASTIETVRPQWRIADFITWAKKRAYGKSTNYLFTREECCILARGSPVFNVPYLETKRGYPGFAQDEIVGYFDGCYHSQHEDPSHSCMSSGSQAQSKGDVHELLRQISIQLGSGSSQEEAQGLVGEEQRTLGKVSGEVVREKPHRKNVNAGSSQRQKTRDTFRIDTGRFKRGLDGHVPSIRHSDNGQREESGQFSLDRSDRQLCWVCTWEHLCHVVASKPLEVLRRTRRVGSASGIHSTTSSIEDVEIAKKVVKYSAKSEYLRRTNVWTDINELFKGKLHPTQKPDRLYEVLVATHSNAGDTVFDPCAGSGTTARACRKLGRKFVIIEKDREYLEIAGIIGK